MKSRLIFSDQSIGKCILNQLSLASFLQIIRNLQELGVNYIDLPVTDAKQGFAAGLQSLLRAKLEPEIKQVEMAHSLGFKKISLSYCHLGQNLATVGLALERAKRLGLGVSLELVNASRFSSSELITIWDIFQGYAIERLVIGDQEGLLEPLATYALMTALIKTTPRVSFHGNNRYGQATANSLSAIQAGVRDIVTGVAGMGDNAPFEEVSMAAKHLLSESNTVSPCLASVCQEILATIGEKIPVDKAIIGQNIFAHESGLHVYGVIHNPAIYEPFSPEEVGLSRQIMIGKHSGTSALQFILGQQGINLNTAVARKLLAAVRQRRENCKQALSVLDLLELYRMEDCHEQ